jgi:uncharacterized protein YbjT (DUF2867 family)
MNILLFGATGMVGQGVLRECLGDSSVQHVVTIGRSATGITHPKLREIIHADLFHYDSVVTQLSDIDACFFCLGVSSAGMKEVDYMHVTHDLTLAAASVLVKINPSMTFIYISGAGADSTEREGIMWSRVKGKIENALLQLPFNGYIFRPGAIQPMHGIRSRTRWYRVFYSLMKPVLPLFRAMFPNLVTTTERVGRAMLHVATKGCASKILETRDINIAGA